MVCNVVWMYLDVVDVLDGDVDLDGYDFSCFDVLFCLVCGGIVKLDVVFFGENVLCECVEVVICVWFDVDVVLVVGFLLMVFFGYCFVVVVVKVGKLVVMVNLGVMWVDLLVMLKIDVLCVEVMVFLFED